MKFYPDNAPLPENLRTDAFVLMPLTPAHVELDYAALMSSKEMLRLWSGSSWPADNFTVAQNREDLAWHWDEHQKRIAFTFTMLNLTEDTCLGCVYIKPIAEIFGDNEEWKTAVSSHSALIRFWTIQNLDKTLLNPLHQWFLTDWAFSDIYWHTPAKNHEQVTLFKDNRFQDLGIIRLPERGGDHTLFK